MSEKVENEAAPGPCVTRAEAALILGCSVPYVRIFERDGKLTARRDGPGTIVTILRSEVDALAATWKRKLPFRTRLTEKKKMQGTLSARVFSLFKAGKSLPDIVIETKTDPTLVRKLWEEYQTGLGKRPQSREEAEIARSMREHQKEMKRRQWQEFQLKMAKLRVEATTGRPATS